MTLKKGGFDMRQENKLIVIEGLDGSGKATQAALLAQALHAGGRAVRKITFPDYDSQSSALVKMYLAGDVGDVGDVNAYAASSFYAADRYISFVTDWKKDYLAGHTIIADRYTTSNAAHQMAKLGRGEWDSYLDWLYDYEFVRMQLPPPDAVLYLDVPPDASRKLLKRRYADTGTAEDIHERNLEYLLNCRTAALYAATKLSWTVIECCQGETLLPVEEIFDNIQQVVSMLDISID